MSGYRKNICAYLSLAFVLAGSPLGSAVAGPLRDNFEEAQNLRASAFASYRAGDFEAARDGMKAILALRPGHPTYFLNVASLSAKTGQHEAALTALKAYVAAGGSVDVAEDEDFVAVSDDPRFQAIVAQLASNGEPLVASDVAFTLDRQTGLTEGIAYDAKRDRFIVSSISEATLYSVERAGHTEVLLSASDLGIVGGFMGMRYDSSRDELWATYSAVAQVRDIAPDDIGTGGYHMLELGSDISLVHAEYKKLDGDGHVYGDLLVADTGVVYVVDSESPMISSLARPDDIFLARDFVSPQGIADTPDESALIVADYALGLLRVDLDGDAVTRLPGPANSNLRGIDGLYRYGDGLIGIQNGARPKRIIYIHMNDGWTEVTDIEVIEKAVPGWEEPTLGVIVGDELYYIANSGWTISANGPPQPEALEKRGNVIVRRIDLSELN